MIRSGNWPLWTHELLSGYPLLSMAQIGVGYPLTWGYLFLPGHWAETIYVLAPYVLVPTFTYAYCREVGRSRMAALLAGLSFSYGGFIFGKYTNNGMLSNAVLWLPLILIALERSLRGNFLRCLLGASVAYVFAVLTGIGQGFVFAGIVALAYASFLTFVRPRQNGIEAREDVRWSSMRRWAPLLVMTSALFLAAGVAAFQILETAQASNLSVRRTLSYTTFGEGSLTLGTVWRSLLFIYYVYDAIDVTAFMAPLVIILALLGLIYFARKPERDSRVFFWITAVAIGFVLMLGVNTPLYRLVYEVPVLNRFRVPARHTLEWSFGLAVLAAYGWDASVAIARRRKEATNKWPLALAMTAVLLALATAGWWLYALGRPESPYDIHHAQLPRSTYLLFKGAHTLLLLVGLFMILRASTRWRNSILAAIILLACLTEPYFVLRSWWLPLHKTSAELSSSYPSLATQYLRQFPVEEHRIYTRVDLFHEGPWVRERVDPHNLTLLFGLHNAAGYEPLMLERYSRLLGNVGVDSVNPRPGFPRDDNIFSADSHVLDLLNTSFVVGYSNFSKSLVGGGKKKGIEFPAVDLGVNLKPGESVTLQGIDVTGDALGIVSSLSHAPVVENGSIVARILLVASDGAEEVRLLAGRDTAEWAYERPDVRASIKHSMAEIFDSFPGDEQDTFPAHRYWTVIPLSSTRPIDRVEITNVNPSASLALWKAVVPDSGRQITTPLNNEGALISEIKDQTRWERSINQNGVLILRNLRSKQRAWMVTAAESVDAEEALRRVRGESPIPFDPFTVALLEVPQAQLPILDSEKPAGKVERLTYKPNAIEIVTESNGQSLLVVSQTDYPGWIATVDGNPATLQKVDYVAQAVVVPAGRHLVELRYTAPAASRGAIISLLTLVLLSGLGVIARVASRRAVAHHGS